MPSASGPNWKFSLPSPISTTGISFTIFPRFYWVIYTWVPIFILHVHGNLPYLPNRGFHVQPWRRWSLFNPSLFCLSTHSLECLKGLVLSRRRPNFPWQDPKLCNPSYPVSFSSMVFILKEKQHLYVTHNKARSRLAHMLLEDTRIHRVLSQSQGWVDGWMVGWITKGRDKKIRASGSQEKLPWFPQYHFLTKKTKPYPRSSTCFWQDSRANLSPRSPGIPFVLPTCTLQRAFPNPTHFAAEWCACSLRHCRSSFCKGMRWGGGGEVRAVKAPERVGAWRGLKKDFQKIKTK